MITFLFGRKRPPLRRRSIENPNTPLSDPDDWLVEAWGGGTASSGVVVNQKTALYYAPVWRAVNLISSYVAKVPLVLYKRIGTGKDRDLNHPAYKLLKHKPNPSQTFFQFRLIQHARVLLRGNAYGYIFREANGDPREIVPMDPAQTYPVKEDGKLVYITKVLGEDRKLLPENVLHIRGLGDGLFGYSVVGQAKESLGLGMAAGKYGSVFFRNSARPSAVLEHPGILGDEAVRALRDGWEKLHTGLDEKHRIAILEEGMKLNPFGMSNEDAQFLQTRQFEIREVANWFGLPPHKLGDTTRTAFASLEQENQSLLDDCLDPWFVNWESECWDKLLTENQKQADSHVVEFLRQALVRADLSARSTFYASALQNGWMNRDEVRGRENMNPIPDGEGEKFFVPKNMGLSGEEEEPGGGPPVPAPPPPGPPPVPPSDDDNDDEEENDRARKIQAAHRALLCDVVFRAVRRISPHVRKQAKNSASFMGWMEDSMEKDHRAFILEAAGPSVMAVEAAGPGGKIAGRLVDLFFRHLGEALLTASECQPKDLERSMAAACERLEVSLPAVVVGEWMEE